MLLADIDAPALVAAVSGLQEAGVAADAHQVDLRDREAVARLVERAASLGTISTACLNAGVSYSGTTVWETPREAWDFVFGVNCFALVNSIAGFIPHLIAQGTPADVIVTASMAGTVGVTVHLPGGP